MFNMISQSYTYMSTNKKDTSPIKGVHPSVIAHVLKGGNYLPTVTVRWHYRVIIGKRRGKSVSDLSVLV